MAVSITLVASFFEAETAEQVRVALLERQLAQEAVVLSRRQDGPEETAGPFLTLAGADARRPGTALPTAGQPNLLDGEENAPDGRDRPPDGQDEDLQTRLGPGAAVGATIGGTVGALAATYVIPGVGAPGLGAAPLLTTLLGAGLGSLLGAAWQGAGGEVDASRPYNPAVLGGALLVAVCPAGSIADAREAVAARGPLAIREHQGG